MTTIQVPLSRGLFTLIDSDDAALVLPHKWTAYKTGRAVRQFYAGRSASDGVVFLHRLIAGASGILEVDHVNGDTLDNRRANLRVCTQQQNTWNKRQHNKHGFKGVEQHRRRFRARIMCDGVTHNLGFHATAEEAARAYDRAARRLFGAFAWLNFPNE